MSLLILTLKAWCWKVILLHRVVQSCLELSKSKLAS